MKYPELFDPAAVPRRDQIFAAMRRDDPVYYACGSFEGWFFTAYDDVHRLFLDQRLEIGSARSVIARQSAEAQRQLQPLSDALSLMLTELPTERHAVVHELLRGYFTPRVVRQLRDPITRLADELLAGLEGREEFDLCSEIANPLPARVIAQLLGVPEADQARFVQWSQDLLAIYRPFQLDAYLGAQRSLLAIVSYCKEQMAIGRDTGEDNILMLLARAIDDGRIDEGEALVNCAMLLFAGHETTATLIPMALRTLTENPGQLEALRADPGLMPGAIEELLRYCNVGIFMRRTALQDIEFNGHAIQRGDLLFLGVYAANRDPRYFDDPHAFDLHRRAPKKSLTFGVGKHYCLGAALARLELEVVLRRLLLDTRRYLPQADRIDIRPAPLLTQAIRVFPVSVVSDGASSGSCLNE